MATLLINYCTRERTAALRVSQETGKRAEAALHLYSKSNVGREVAAMDTFVTECIQQDRPSFSFLDLVMVAV